jgi:putative sigma-54 modulation protein
MDVIRAASVTGKRGPQVIRTKKLAVRPMSVEEAVMQLDLMDNDFLVFRSAVSGGVSVVYRRKDGHYGLIEPDAS